jgi:pimeloyl-ACP methyl ester carboxylesterase
MTDVFSVVVPDVPVLDVVFLHGLGGDARRTWDAGEAFWPGWLGEDVLGIAVWSVGYAASPSGWLGRAMPIQDRAVNVLARLRNEGIGDRPLIFVTHSMGGLLANRCYCTHRAARRTLRSPPPHGAWCSWPPRIPVPIWPRF